MERDSPGMVGDTSCTSRRVETFDAFDGIKPSGGNPFHDPFAILAALVLKHLPCGLESFFADASFSVHERFSDFVHCGFEPPCDDRQLRILSQGSPAVGLLAPICHAIEVVDHVHCGQMSMVGPSLLWRAANAFHVFSRFAQGLP
jgi:hypothetical protein